ncbi:MAG TPA: Npt1/Npt2 family nucleotide transporter [Vicinamibacteria bacterium]|nr:Npt1/Npt2 family nucleotide transporter [Vicinamibacteria bacterium]
MFSSLADVRPEERRGVAAAFLTLLGVLAGHTLLETARDALFLSRLPANQLPWMYLAIAGVAFLASRLRVRPLPGALGPYSFSLLLLASAGVTFTFWLFRRATGVGSLYFLYVWSGLFGTVAIVRFWSLLSDVYTVTQAKRLYRIIAAGSVLGAILGATIGSLVTARYAARSLVLASAIVLALTAIAAALFVRPAGDSRRDEPDVASSVSAAAAWALVREHPYVRPLAGLVLTSTVAVTLADYLFKSVVAVTVPATELGLFFAIVYGVLNVLALLVQILGVGYLLGRLGVHRALWLLPVLLVAGSAAFLVSGGLFAALLLKGTDGALRHTLHRTGTELLYVPLPDAMRARVKPFIDTAGQRGGQALASILILTPVAFLPQADFLALSLAGVALLWILTAADLRQNYLDLFRSALREGAIATRLDLPQLDLGSLEALFAALNSQDDREVIAAMDLLEAQGKANLVPALILYHPSSPVVLRGLELFVAAKRADFLPIADRLLSHGDPQVRAAALRARSLVQSDEELLRRMSHDASPTVRAAAAVGMVAGGWFSDEVQRVIDELRASQSPEAGIALARAIRLQPGPAFEPVLLDLADAPEPEVLSEVAAAMAAAPSERFLPALLPLIAQREVRPSARAAFVAHGEAGLRYLDQALSDHALPQEIRRHLPRTISAAPAQQAAPILLRHLADEPDGLVRFKILRGIGRIRADEPTLPLDTRVIEQAKQATLEASFRLIHWRQVLEEGAIQEPRRRTPGHDLLTTMLRDKEVHAIERLFRLLGLRFPREDVHRIFRGFQSESAKIRASSRELLENLLRPPLQGAVLALVDPAPSQDRLASAAPFYTPRPLAYEELLGLMLEQASESLRCIAAHHVAELGLRSFLPRIEAMAPVESAFFVSRVLERAATALARAEPQHA